jgi:hypothetical protein
MSMAVFTIVETFKKTEIERETLCQLNPCFSNAKLDSIAPNFKPSRT